MASKKSSEGFRPLEAQLKALIASQPAQKPLPKSEQRPEKPSRLTPEERKQLAQADRESVKDDDFLFRRVMSGVEPLSSDKRGRVGSAKVSPKPAKSADIAEKKRQQEDAKVRDQLLELVEGATRFEVTDDGTRLEGRRMDLPPPIVRKLRHGEFGVDARLDLHGTSAEDAHNKLSDFLRDRRTRKDKMALVIHGRGEHSPAQIGVLRGEIAAWLSQGRASVHVAAFTTALPEDGGAGALYVLLRP